jgi:hypothetical protein
VAGNTVKGVLAGAVVGLVVVMGLGLLTPARGEPEKPTGPAAYEYKVVEFGTGQANGEDADDMGKKLNALAKDGWEYVGPVANATVNDRHFLQGFVAFKRAKK